jgi:hypothetical protein
MKDNKHIKSFNEATENLNISDVSDSEKSDTSKNIYLLSFNLGIGDEYPICYELIYADSFENAKDKLKEKYKRVYEIDNCTII